MNRVKGKVAVVTGAGSGIGRALALELARRGARLALADIDTAGLGETAAQAEDAGAEVRTGRLDVGDRAGFARFADTVAEHYEVVHQLYNNAGVSGMARPVWEADYADFTRVLDVNLWGVIHGTKEFLPHLIASGDGHLVNVSSLSGFMAQAGLAPYCASKFAVRGFTEAVRADTLRAGHPVRVTVVHPGGVKTNIAATARAHARDLNPGEARRQEDRARIYEDKLFRTTPAQAAKTILDGVEAGRSRVLIGSDARSVDLVVRLVPALYPRLTNWWEKRTFPDAR